MADRKVSIKAILPTQIITMLLGVFAMLVDSIMINIYLGDAAQAAYGLTNPITLLINAFGGMISAGTQILVGRSAGRGRNDEEISKIMSTAMITGIAGAIVIAMPNIVFPKRISFILGAVNDELAEMTASYLRVVVLSYPLMVVFLIIPVFVQFRGRKTDILVMALLIIVLDVLFNFINVKIMNGGMQGMATASVLSYVAATIYAIITIFRKPQFRIKFGRFSGKTIAVILRYGVVYLVYKLCTAVMSLAMNRILSNYGSVYLLAANSILSSIMLVTGAFASGIGSTTTMICSYHVGQKDPAALKVFLRRMHIVSLVMNLFITLVCVFGSRGIVSVFRPRSPELFECAVLALCLYSGCMIFHSADHIYRNYDISIDRKGTAILVCSLDNLILPLIAAVVIGYFFNVRYVWLCYPIGQAAALLVSFLIHRSGGNIGNVRFKEQGV